VIRTLLKTTLRIKPMYSIRALEYLNDSQEFGI
jgi:hypothetical protein